MKEKETNFKTCNQEYTEQEQRKHIDISKASISSKQQRATTERITNLHWLIPTISNQIVDTTYNIGKIGA